MKHNKSFHYVSLITKLLDIIVENNQEIRL